MEIKELYRSTVLIFVFIVLIVLAKISSDYQFIEIKRVLPQRTLAENPVSRHFLIYPQIEPYSIRGKDSVVSFEKDSVVSFETANWVSQKSLPLAKPL